MARLECPPISCRMKGEPLNCDVKKIEKPACIKILLKGETSHLQT